MRYYDELTHAARTTFRIKATTCKVGSREEEAFAALGIKGLDILVALPDLFDRVAYALQGLEGEGPSAVAMTLFGVDNLREVLSLATDVFDETEYLHKGREDRIKVRIAAGTHTPADVDLIKARAVEMSDEVMLDINPFDGDETETKVLSRDVVRGRVAHTCHWSRLTIPPGERHLVIKEVAEGKFVTTRHSMLAVYLDTMGEDPGLAAHLAPKPIDEVAA
ncbi:hypothetical protein [uncultured Methylobacterium sp.]|uniref:hypothetical protein n=1 Tax=uncultured Methylobacterium sp. TaxID=157278 RepID=UPI0035CB00A8